MSHRPGFTLIELLVVMSIIALLMALGSGIYRFAQDNGKRSRAQAEIAGFETALESYRIDNGNYPGITTGTTETGVSPKEKFDPKDGYRTASQTLFEGLAGRASFNAENTNARQYFEFRPSQVDELDGNSFVVDPWRAPYGYGIFTSDSRGYNVGFPDLWSTAGNSDPQSVVKWVTNWTEEQE